MSYIAFKLNSKVQWCSWHESAGRANTLHKISSSAPLNYPWKETRHTQIGAFVLMVEYRW